MTGRAVGTARVADRINDADTVGIYTSDVALLNAAVDQDPETVGLLMQVNRRLKADGAGSPVRAVVRDILRRIADGELDEPNPDAPIQGRTCFRSWCNPGHSPDDLIVGESDMNCSADAPNAVNGEMELSLHRPPKYREDGPGLMSIAMEQGRLEAAPRVVLRSFQGRVDGRQGLNLTIEEARALSGHLADLVALADAEAARGVL